MPLVLDQLGSVLRSVLTVLFVLSHVRLASFFLIFLVFLVHIVEGREVFTRQSFCRNSPNAFLVLSASYLLVRFCVDRYMCRCSSRVI